MEWVKSAEISHFEASSDYPLYPNKKQNTGFVLNPVFFTKKRGLHLVVLNEGCGADACSALEDFRKIISVGKACFCGNFFNGVT